MGRFFFFIWKDEDEIEIKMKKREKVSLNYEGKIRMINGSMEKKIEVYKKNKKITKVNSGEKNSNYPIVM